MPKHHKKKGFTFLEQFRHLKHFLLLAGIRAHPWKVYTILFIISTIVDIFFISYFIILTVEYQLHPIYPVLIFLIMITLGLFLIFMIVWLMFLFILDYLKFKRRSEVEEILPEFLRLVSANHRAGLPLDMSLWKANRPRFGILSEEINEVAKRVYGSGDLTGPLIDFGNKYDSPLLRRVISNLVEGVKTGSDIAALLDDISNQVRTIKNTRKELASEVENYMLFITITVLIISPLMFSLTNKMAGLIENVKAILANSFTEGVAAIDVPFTFEPGDPTRPFSYFFDIFVYLMMGTNSIISVLLMSMIKYGNLQSELKRIPVYYVVGISFYAIFKIMFANFLVI